MNANARKVHGLVMGFGVACAVATALPCVAADATPAGDTVTVEGQSIPVDSSAPAKHHKSAPAEENIGFFSGGAIAGGITGALLGDHYHKQKLANQELATNLSGSNAEKVKLTQTVTQLDGSLGAARELVVNVAFRTGDAHLTAEDIDQLTTLAQLAKGMPDVKIQVSGHADPRGSVAYNAELSKDRAASVAAV